MTKLHLWLHNSQMCCSLTNSRNRDVTIYPMEEPADRLMTPVSTPPSWYYREPWYLKEMSDGGIPDNKMAPDSQDYDPASSFVLGNTNRVEGCRQRGLLMKRIVPIALYNTALLSPLATTRTEHYRRHLKQKLARWSSDLNVITSHFLLVLNKYCGASDAAETFTVAIKTAGQASSENVSWWCDKPEGGHFFFPACCV